MEDLGRTARFGLLLRVLVALDCGDRDSSPFGGNRERARMLFVAIFPVVLDAVDVLVAFRATRNVAGKGLVRGLHIAAFWRP